MDDCERMGGRGGWTGGWAVVARVGGGIVRGWWVASGGWGPGVNRENEQRQNRNQRINQRCEVRLLFTSTPDANIGLPTATRIFLGSTSTIPPTPDPCTREEQLWRMFAPASFVTHITTPVPHQIQYIHT